MLTLFDCLSLACHRSSPQDSAAAISAVDSPDTNKSSCSFPGISEKKEDEAVVDSIAHLSLCFVIFRMLDLDSCAVRILLGPYD